MIRVTGLWSRRNARGEITSIQGNLGGVRIVILAVERSSERQPDFVLNFAAPTPPEPSREGT